MSSRNCHEYHHYDYYYHDDTLHEYIDHNHEWWRQFYEQHPNNYWCRPGSNPRWQLPLDPRCRKSLLIEIRAL